MVESLVNWFTTLFADLLPGELVVFLLSMMPILEFDKLSARDILNRDIREAEDVGAAVDAVLAEVKLRGDAALRDYTEKFDGVRLDALQVSKAELEAAWNSVEPDFIETLRMAADNIRRFHEFPVIFIIDITQHMDIRCDNLSHCFRLMEQRAVEIDVAGDHQIRIFQQFL